MNQLRGSFPVIFQIPFNSKNKFHVVIVRGSFRPEMDAGSNGKEVFTAFMKGAPEVLLKQCSRYEETEQKNSLFCFLLAGRYLRNREVHVIDEEFTSGALEAYPYFARRGQRVLGFCLREFEMDKGVELSAKNIPLSEMTFIGFGSCSFPFVFI